MNSPRDQRPFNFGALLTASAVAAVAFLVLGLIAFARPASKAVPAGTPYTQHVSFGYHAHVRPGLIYPNGSVSTGDPIFLSLVRELAVSVDYRLSANIPAAITGTEDVLLELTGPAGWSRSFVLVPPTHFTGTHTRTDVALDIGHLQSLLAKVAQLTGGSAVAGNSVAIVPEIHVKGNIAGHPVNKSFAPKLGFELSPTQLVPQAPSTSASGAVGPGSATSSVPKAGYGQTQTAAVATAPGRAPTTLTVLGISPTIILLRWLALIGLVTSCPLAAYAFLRKRSEPLDETYRIRSQYGHMIVPIVGGEDLGWPPVDVASIKSLVQLAESGQRLILHSRSGNVDTYLVNDEGTVYRYQVKPSKVVWGDWAETATPVKAAA